MRRIPILRPCLETLHARLDHVERHGRVNGDDPGQGSDTKGDDRGELLTWT